MSIRFMAILAAVLVAGVAVANIATNAGLMNVFLKVDNGFSEQDVISNKQFDQTTAALNTFVLSPTVATNKMAVPDVTTAGYAIFQNIGTATVYVGITGDLTPFLKLLTNEAAGPMRLGTTNVSFWTLGTLVGKVKGKVYAE